MLAQLSILCCHPERVRDAISRIGRSVTSQSRILSFIPRWLVYVLGLLPAVQLFYAGVTNQLGPDPVSTLENALGEWALWFLIAGLAVSPLQYLTGIRLIRYRRAIGLIAFAYVVLHFSVYLFLDRQMDWSAIWIDILKRPYITFGVSSFVLLLPLALTSNDWSVRRLGAVAWRRLHWLVYIAAPLGALHYILLVKAWPVEPFIYLAVILGLLAFRLIRQPRQRRGHRSPSAASGS